MIHVTGIKYSLHKPNMFMLNSMNKLSKEIIIR